MLGVALELDRPALARLHVQAAPGSAAGAGRGVVGGLARDHLFGLDHVRDELRGKVGVPVAAGGHGAGGGRTGDLQEASSRQIRHGLPVPSSGR